MNALLWILALAVMGWAVVQTLSVAVAGTAIVEQTYILAQSVFVPIITNYTPFVASSTLSLSAGVNLTNAAGLAIVGGGLGAIFAFLVFGGDFTFTAFSSILPPVPPQR